MLYKVKHKLKVKPKLVKPKIKSNDIWYLEARNIDFHKDIRHKDSPSTSSDPESLIDKTVKSTKYTIQVDGQRKQYLWYEGDVSMNLVNYVEDNARKDKAYIDRKVYGVNVELYVKTKSKYTTRVKGIKVMNKPYTVNYNDSRNTICIYLKYMTYMSNAYYASLYTGITNKLLVRFSTIGLLLIYEYYVCYIYGDYWLMFKVDNYIFMICVVIKNSEFASIHVYVVDC